MRGRVTLWHNLKMLQYFVKIRVSNRSVSRFKGSYPGSDRSYSRKESFSGIGF